jgi:hypothetical protein
MRPLVGGELDDRSHERASRQERDGFVDEVFRVAGLPLMHPSVRPGRSQSVIATADLRDPRDAGTRKAVEAVKRRMRAAGW